MSIFPTIPTDPNVSNRFSQYPNQSYPVQQRSVEYQQGSQGILPEDIISPLKQEFSPKMHGTGTMIPNQQVTNKRLVDSVSQSSSVKRNFPLDVQVQTSDIGISRKIQKMGDKILPQTVKDIVPESQAYMDLLTFEKKLDFTITRKRLDIQESIKCPMKHKRKLRIFISNNIYPAKEPSENEEGNVASWELRVEGHILKDSKNKLNKINRKFSSFLKSLVIELDKDLYGPDNHFIEWHHTATTEENDGFRVKRPGDKNVRCSILFLLDHQPLQFKLDQRLALLLGIHTQTKPVIINALWQFIKTHKLQDSNEKEYINCNKYLEEIFNCSRLKFSEIPHKLNTLLYPPDPIVINHIISVEGVKQKQTSCYDIDVEVDDRLKMQMNNALQFNASHQEIQNLDNRITETVELIKQLLTNRKFFLSFAKDPQQHIYKWLISQTKDLKTITDAVGNPEEERRAEFYDQPWIKEAVNRYLYSKFQQKQSELKHKLNICNP